MNWNLSRNYFECTFVYRLKSLPSTAKTLCIFVTIRDLQTLINTMLLFNRFTIKFYQTKRCVFEWWVHVTFYTHIQKQISALPAERKEKKCVKMSNRVNLTIPSPALPAFIPSPRLDTPHNAPTFDLKRWLSEMYLHSYCCWNSAVTPEGWGGDDDRGF